MGKTNINNNDFFKKTDWFSEFDKQLMQLEDEVDKLKTLDFTTIATSISNFKKAKDKQTKLINDLSKRFDNKNKTLSFVHSTSTGKLFKQLIANCKTLNDAMKTVTNSVTACVESLNSLQSTSINKVTPTSEADELKIRINGLYDEYAEEAASK